jgi:hypothetical protein
VTNTKLTELLVTVLVAVGALAFAIQGSLPPKWAAIAASVSAAAYSISRGIAKFGQVTTGPPGVIVPQPVQSVPSTVTAPVPPA